VVAVVYTILRLLVQGLYVTGALAFDEEEELAIPVDLQVYLDTAASFYRGEDIYLQESLDYIEYHFPYPPAYAMAFGPFLWLPPLAVAILHTLLHVGAYALLYVLWGRIFARRGLVRASETLAWLLPVWLVFSAFWDDLGYLNIYTLMALLATLLIDAILEERLGWSVLWLSLILQTKPMWAFALAVPLLLGRYRYFLKLLGLAAVVYLAVAGVTILVAGPAYGWEQYLDYFHLLSRLGGEFPWREPVDPFLGYNHSVKQTIVYFLDVTPLTLALATVVKALLLAPLGIVCLRHLFRPADCAGHRVPRLALDLALALYLGAFLWLDIVWELTLGIALFTYLLATWEGQRGRVLAWVVFLPYALIDMWRLLSYILFGPDVILPGQYVQTDPSLYLPLILIVILAFYVLLVWRLWARPVRLPAEGEA
jgi:hypothetical protein